MDACGLVVAVVLEPGVPASRARRWRRPGSRPSATKRRGSGSAEGVDGPDRVERVELPVEPVAAILRRRSVKGSGKARLSNEGDGVAEEQDRDRTPSLRCSRGRRGRWRPTRRAPRAPAGFRSALVSPVESKKKVSKSEARLKLGVLGALERGGAGALGGGVGVEGRAAVDAVSWTVTQLHRPIGAGECSWSCAWRRRRRRIVGMKRERLDRRWSPAAPGACRRGEVARMRGTKR